MTAYVSPATRQRLRDAMERLFTGVPQHTDGTLNKNNLARSSGEPSNHERAVDILAEWDARVSDSPAGLAARRRDEQLDQLRSRLRASHLERRKLQDQLDAAATVIAALHTENVAVRRHAADTRARIVPLSLEPRTAGRAE